MQVTAGADVFVKAGVLVAVGHAGAGLVGVDDGGDAEVGAEAAKVVVDHAVDAGAVAYYA